MEEVYGSARYLFLYIVMGAVGFFCSAFGGSLFGGSERRDPRIGWTVDRGHNQASGLQMQAMRSRLISWVVTIFAFGFLFRGMRRNGAHFGGLVAGFLLENFCGSRTTSWAGTHAGLCDGLDCRNCAGG